MMCTTREQEFNCFEDIRDGTITHKIVSCNITLM